MKKIFYNKLIRDGIIARIEQRGYEAAYRVLDRKEFTKELIKKVEEEAGGLAAAKTKQELIDELADITEVIEEIKKIKRITNKQILIARRKKIAKSGAFKKRLFLIWSSDTKYKTNERRNKK